MPVRSVVFLSVVLSLAVPGLAATAPPAPRLPVPTPEQVAWQDMEITVFIHFGVNTFTNREWGEGTEDPKIFNPTKLDARQWVRAAKAGGAGMVILTAKHHDGFCLWPSRYTEHSVKNSPWRGGKGDVVRELADACRAEDVKLGLYLSPWDRHEKTYGDSPKYNRYYVNQLTELLTNYGPVAELFFDGACGEGPNGKRQEYDWPAFHATVRRLQPKAIMFSDAGPDTRWIGNERGIAGDPCWSTFDPRRVPYAGFSPPEVRKLLAHGDPNGSVWRPGECDVSIRPGWFWHKDQDDKVRSVDNLVDLYFQSFGRNSLLLLNLPPNTDGLVSEPDVRAMAGFRERLAAIFKTNLAAGKPARASNTRGGDEAFGPQRAVDGKPESYWATDDEVTAGWLEVDLGKPTEFRIARLEEPITLGQRVAEYRIDVLDGERWKTIVRGTTIGNKKLDRFAPVTAQRVRLVIDKSLACPLIKTFGLY